MNIMLFHSTYGLRPAVHAAAARLRAAGHEVHVPDLFDGRTFETVEEGMAFKDEVGKDELLRRAVLAAAPYSERGLVYAGFSFGASTAQTLALGDEKARGLLLLHGTSDIAENASVDELPVQLHVADPDPFETHDWLNSWYLQMQRTGADVEVSVTVCGAPAASTVDQARYAAQLSLIRCTWPAVNWYMQESYV
ncbi:dienelactone hydrolase family protein [Streptomyces sp. P5_D11]